MFFKKSKEKKAAAAAAASGSNSSSVSNSSPPQAHQLAYRPAEASTPQPSQVSAQRSTGLKSQPTLQIGPIDQSKRTPTESSHYSCTNLPSDNECRYLKAAEVRRQVQEAHGKRPRVVKYGATSTEPKMAKYPKTFENSEGFGMLQSKTPRKEYPLVPVGNWDPRSTDPEKKLNARAVFNSGDRTKFDVVYHDPTKLGSGLRRDLSMANYRPAVIGEKVKA
ncbi:hypothetical protein Ct61P_02009 [Colletotrichum tofieldiae]|nr:hypothetical protein Ct61P_02009 [Colletotrichum tofieldiae]